MNAYATAIRKATLEVARLQRDLGIRAKATKEHGRIDVFDALARLELPLIFKPLDGLLGAYLHDPSPGVLVTTKRPLSVQRFTAAHELAHHHLRHQPSLDDESILRRAPFFSTANGQDVQELEANAFAAAFLLPRWLVQWHCARQEWHAASLQEPKVIYQLALRAGTSYEAACWTLHRYGVMPRYRAQALAAISPKTIKQALLGDIEPEHYYGDVWLLTEKDANTRIEGGPSDFFVMRLPEHSGSGYLWQLETLDQADFAIVQDSRESPDSDQVGGLVTRRITTKSQRQQSGEVRIAELRPWQLSSPLSTFAIRYDLMGSEAEGWSRAERRYRLEAA